MSENRKPEQGIKLRGAEKVARIPVKVIPTVETPRKPDWIRVKMAAPEEVQRIKSTLREQKLHTVCEEAACPNLPECFGGGTATFMIMGDICTRRVLSATWHMAVQMHLTQTNHVTWLKQFQT